MKRDPFLQLHRLRMKRKEMAFERVAMRQAAFARAEQQLAEASETLSAHAEKARARESASHADIAGKTLSFTEVMNFQTELALLAHRLDELRREQTGAGARRDAAQSEMKAAAALFREYHRKVEKLDYLLAETQRGHRRRELALSEASDDDITHRQRIGTSHEPQA